MTSIMSVLGTEKARPTGGQVGTGGVATHRRSAAAPRAERPHIRYRQLTHTTQLCLRTKPTVYKALTGAHE
jgi:hypothetical protein